MNAFNAGPLLALLALGTPAWAQDICKWVDSAGTVHYFDARQADRTCVALIRVIHPDPDELARAQERYQRMQEQWRAQADTKPAGAAQPARTQAQRQAEIDSRCQDARIELRFLEEAWGMRLVRPSAQENEGPIVWLDDQERQALTDAWRKQVQDWCGAAPPPTAGPEPDRAYAAPPPPLRRRPPAQ